MYSLLSSSGKCSGKSPFNCSRSGIGLLQTLHLARSPGGGVRSSSHVCGGLLPLAIVPQKDHQWMKTYRPSTKVTDRVICRFCGSVTQQHSSLGVVPRILEARGVAVVRIHCVRNLERFPRTGQKLPLTTLDTSASKTSPATPMCWAKSRQRQSQAVRNCKKILPDCPISDTGHGAGWV